MRAIGVREFGGPEALEVLDLPEPEPGPGQVRVRVHAAAVNPTDTLIRSGAGVVHANGRQASTPPYVPGMDAAGVVDRVGPGVDDRLRPGQAVVVLVVPFGVHGAYSDRIVVPAGSVVPAPVGFSAAEASTLLMNATTARLAVDAVALQSGRTLAVTGAAGALGAYVVQLAHHAGLRVLADAADRDVDLVRSFGADVVVPRGDDVAQGFLRAAPGGVEGLVDAALQGDVVLPGVADGGTVVTVRGGRAAADRGVRVVPVQARDAVVDTGGLLRLVRLAEQRVLQLRVKQVHPAAEAPAAHWVLEAGGLRGRLVLDFAD